MSADAFFLLDNNTESRQQPVKTTVADSHHDDDSSRRDVIHRASLHSVVGRIDTLAYATHYTLALVVMISAIVAIGFLAPTLDKFSDDAFSSPFVLALLASLVATSVMLYGVWLSIAATAKRLHDLGLSAWWYLTFLFPIGGTLFLAYVTVKRADTEQNKYGAPGVTNAFERVAGHVGVALIMLVVASSTVTSVYPLIEPWL